MKPWEKYQTTPSQDNSGEGPWSKYKSNVAVEDNSDYSIGPKETSLRTAKPLNPMDRLNQGIGKLFEANKVEEEARASNTVFLAKDLVKEKGIPLSDAIKEVSNNYDQIVADRYNSFTPRQQLKEGMSKVSTPLAIAGMIAAPIPTALGIAGFSALEAGKEKLIQNNPNLSESSRLGLDLATIIGGGKVIHGAFKGMPEGLKGSAPSMLWKATKEVRENSASSMINSLIRAKAKDLFFDKNPGRAIVEEKITGNSMDVLLEKTSGKLQEYNDIVTEKLSSKENMEKVSDYKGVLKPIENAITRIKTMFPRTAKATIDKLTGVYLDLIGAKQDPTSGRMVATRDFKMNPLEATEFRRKIEDSDVINWNKEASKEDQAISLALKDVYGEINKIIRKDVPGIEKVNKKISSLITAKRLLKMQKDYLATKDPFFYGGRAGGIIGSLIPIPGAGNLGGAAIGLLVEKALVSPAVRTRVASWLASSPKEKIATEFIQTPEMVKALQITFEGNKLLTTKITQAQKLLSAPSTTYGKEFEMVAPEESAARTRVSKLEIPKFSGVRSMSKNQVGQTIEDVLARRKNIKQN